MLNLTPLTRLPSYTRLSLRRTFTKRTQLHKMPQYNVSLKEGADASQLETAKKQVTEQGGKVVHEFKLVKGFTAEFPADKLHTLSSNDALHVEADSEVKTQ